MKVTFIFSLLFLFCRAGFAQQQIITNIPDISTHPSNQLPEGKKRFMASAALHDTLKEKISNINLNELAPLTDNLSFNPKEKNSDLSFMLSEITNDNERGTPPSVLAPGNDNCASAISLGTVSTTTTTTGTTSSATADLLNPSCFTSQKNVWYSFVVPAGGGTYSVSVTGGASLYPNVAIIQFATACTVAGAVQYACGGQCSSGTASTMTTTAACLSPGTYYIMVDNDNSTSCGLLCLTPDCYTGTAGSFTLTVAQTSSGYAPANDNCSGVINLGTVSTNTTVAGTNYCATADLWTPTCTGSTHNNVWYKFTVPAGGGSYSFAITKGTMTYPDIGIIQFSTACSLTGATQIACYDPSTDANITLNVNCMAAGTYYISVDDDVFGVPGTFTLTVTQNGTNVNDNCASATLLSLTTTNNNAANTVTYSVNATGNNACATADQGNTACFTNNKNLWYKFVPTVTGSFYVGVQAGNMSYPEVNVLSGTCGSFSYVGCSGSSSGTCQPYGYYSSTYSYAGGCNLTAGTTYYVAVDSWSTAGTFTLTVASLSNDGIPNAAIIANCGTAFTSSTIGATNCNNCSNNGGACNSFIDLDCNSGTTASGNSGGADTYSGMTVENDSWYQFCSTAAQTYSVTFAPTTATCIGPGPAQLQMNLFTGTSGNLTWVNGSSTGTSLTYTVALAANGCAFVEVDGLSGENCDYSLNVTTSPGCPLPLELLSFSGNNVDNHKIKLDWILASEKDLNYYLIERSANGKDYSPIAKVKSKGNSTVKGAYYAYDEKPLNGFNYYRLSSVDLNGVQTEASHILVTNKSHLPNFNVYPNPSSGKLNVNLVNFSSEKVNIEIYDAFGKTVWSSSFELSDGTTLQEVDLSEFGSGIYFVKAFDGENIYKQSIIVNKDR